MSQTLPKMITTPTTYNAILDRNEKPVQFIPDKSKKINYCIESNPGAKKFFEHVYISPAANEAMSEYVRLCKDEISWLATIIEGDGFLTIENVFLFKQEVSGTTTELDEHALGEFYTDMLMNPPDGDIEKATDTLDRIRCWGHSHVNMGVNPSAKDDSTMQEFAANVAPTEMDYMVRLIANKKGEIKIDIYYYNRFLKALDVPWTVINHATGNDFAAQIEKLVSKKTYQYTNISTYKGSNITNSNHTTDTAQKKTDGSTESTGNADPFGTSFFDRRAEASGDGWHWCG